jgi:hypothetical protein
VLNTHPRLSVNQIRNHRPNQLRATNHHQRRDIARKRCEPTRNGPRLAATPLMSDLHDD